MAKPKNSSPDWVTAKQLAGVLNCSTRHVYRSIIGSSTYKEGTHWINLSPDAMRPTYRFNFPEIKKILLFQ